MKRSMKMKGKGKTQVAKMLRGPFKQADTMADGPTMGNPKAAKGKMKMSKAREKRLEKAAV